MRDALAVERNTAPGLTWAAWPDQLAAARRTAEPWKAGTAHAIPFHPPATGRTPVGPATVFLYSHDTFGLGHLRRNLAIAERLLRSGRFAVHLLTGSPVIGHWRLPPGLHVHPLPPVVKTGAERYASREQGRSFGLVKGYREALILTLVLRFRPEIFLVDHAPAGMNGELLPALATMRQDLPDTRVMLGLRDILDSPATVRSIWAEQDIHPLLEQAYDDILVYGARELFDVVEAYGIEAPVADRVRYCGHVVAADLLAPRTDAANETPPCWTVERAAGRPVVLVTAGGGGDGFALMDAYLRALALMAPGTCHSAIVTGPLMSAEQHATLAAVVAGREDIELVSYTTDPLPSLRAADLVIAMAGYNTSAEIIAARKRAILVPRPAPRAEQCIRAELLAGLGIVSAVEQGPALAEDLARLVPAALASPPPDEVVWNRFDLNGAERAAAFLTEMIDAHRTADCSTVIGEMA